MTAQLSRERLKEIASLPLKTTSCGLQHAPGAYSTVYSHEIVEMARMLLAGMDSEPVGYLIKDKYNPGGYFSRKNSIMSIRQEDIAEHEVSATPLYTAPTTPLALPDDYKIGEIRVGRLPTMNQDDYPGLGDWWLQLRIGEDFEEVLARVYGSTPQEANNRAAALACHAAMLKAGPVTAARVPDGWKLVPVEPTMPQELAGHKTLYDTGKMSRLMKTRISNIYRAMLAAAPAAPEQEV